MTTQLEHDYVSEVKDTLKALKQDAIEMGKLPCPHAVKMFNLTMTEPCLDALIAHLDKHQLTFVMSQESIKRFGDMVDSKISEIASQCDDIEVFNTLEEYVDDYVGEYSFEADNGTYVPNDNVRLIIANAILGFKQYVRDRVRMSKSTVKAQETSQRDIGGTQTHTLTIAEVPCHTHQNFGGAQDAAAELKPFPFDWSTATRGMAFSKTADDSKDVYFFLGWQPHVASKKIGIFIRKVENGTCTLSNLLYLETRDMIRAPEHDKP